MGRLWTRMLQHLLDSPDHRLPHTWPREYRQCEPVETSASPRKVRFLPHSPHAYDLDWRFSDIHIDDPYLTGTEKKRKQKKKKHYQDLPVATSIKPTGLKPVEWPVSSSRFAYKSRVYFRHSVEVSESEPNRTISPAACQVVPEVI